MTPSDLVQQLLLGAELSGFRFGNHFVLRFERYPGPAPNVVEVDLSGHVTLDTPSHPWKPLLATFPVQTTEVEDPALGALFVLLHWAGGRVVDAAIDGADLVVRWEDGSCLRALGDPNGMGSDWEVYAGDAPAYTASTRAWSEAGTVNGASVGGTLFTTSTKS